MANGALFDVGHRVAFHNGVGYEPEWFIGTVTEVKKGTSVGYRVTWDDGYNDDGPLYSHFELRSASEVEVNA